MRAGASCSAFGAEGARRVDTIMADHSSNPFARLADLLAEKKAAGQDSGASAAGKSEPGAKAASSGFGMSGKPGPGAKNAAGSGRVGRSSAPPPKAAAQSAGLAGRAGAGADDEDAALFLNALGPARPLRGKKAADGGEPLAERLRGAQKALEREGRKNVPDAQGPAAPHKNGGPAGAPFAKHAAPDGAGTRNSAQGPCGANAAGAALAPERSPREKNGAPSACGGMPEYYSAFGVEPSAGEREDAGPSGGAAENPADDLFFKAMQGVRPVTARGRELTRAASPGAQPPAADPAKALRDLLDGTLEFALHHTDEYMEGFVVGLDPLILGRLRAGQFSPEAHIDLHGQNARQAFDSLSWFIKNAYQRGLRTVIVVTGRGNNSPDGVGVLRPLLQQWLSREPFKRVVLAFCTAQASDGGLGAVYVLLRKYKKSRGKIAWEHTPSDDDFPE